jgi:preprotein translocase subunit SecB
MQIKFEHIQFVEVEYKVSSFDKNITKDLETSLGIGSLLSDKNKKTFIIKFDLSLENQTKNFFLKIKAIAHFSTQEEIDEIFANSHFVKVNAPAIAFPYVRAFISNLTLNSGYEPIVLLAINFVKLAEEKNFSNQ